MSEYLCPDCLSFEESLHSPTSEYKHQTLKPNIQALENAAEQECALCRVIYQSLIFDGGVSLQDTDAPIDIMTKDSTIDSVSEESRLDMLSVKVQQRNAAGSTYLSVLFNNGGQKQAFEAYRELVGQLQDPTSDEGMENITRLTLRWIQNCRDTHSQCRQTDVQSKINCLPTRLVNVGTHHDEQPLRLFIPGQDQDSESLEYAALSYAWGPVSNHSFKTTFANLEARIKGLPFSQLPRTIQDAIILTRKLGFKYLWVDALCILQSEGPDDTNHKEDWSREATRFGYYYQNATVTLSATGAKSSDEGLFLPRPAQAFELEPVILRRKSPGGETRDISILPKVPSWISEIKGAPLYERGWAIQERMLSTRVVHFANNMVVWECHECRATEIDHDGLSLKDRDSVMVYEDVSDFMPVFRNLQRQGKGASQVIREWYSFIEGYTSAKFTFAGDRLPALSGISALIQKYIPQKYGAGLWQSAVSEGLAWLREEDSTVNTTHLANSSGNREDFQLRLPSWSWATSRGPVRFLSSLDTWETLLNVENWEVKSAGVNTSGQILEARLRVRGSFGLLDLSVYGLKPCVDPESGTRVLENESKAGEVDYTRAAFMDAGVTAQWVSEASPCILVGTAYVPGSGRTGGVTGCALILEPTGYLQGGIEEYRRIGFLCLPLRDWRSKNYNQQTVELV
ncbi:hypothetical protein NW768_002683 [Fusarium equiseti]|uniref:Heterokaryon incompatibility domain-containing protein n=1 Tax=Fusarium equiseti TaxID=61235 RepID=A0ABQ8RP88_FUSEQ|nr:hypothetical protein NW768_002683 [Fusarium equiseti]